MITSGQIAFGNVRARARSAALLGPAVAAHLRAARDPAARVAALRELEIGGAGAGPEDVHRARVLRSLDDYAVLAASYPRGGSLLVALARLHEIENLKLVFRAAIRGHPSVRWRSLWRPMGRLATLRLAEAEHVRSARDLVHLVSKSPYAALIAATASAEAEPTEAGPARPSSAAERAIASRTRELAFDRFGSQSLLGEARRLSRAEPEAYALVLDLVRERDIDVIRRAAVYGVPPDLAPSLAVLLPQEPDAALLPDLAAWTPDRGPLRRALPRRILPRGPEVESFDALVRALRRRRRRACAAAFIGSPFRLAPAVAYLLLREEETRGLVALAEAAGDPSADGALALAIAGSGLGD